MSKTFNNPIIVGYNSISSTYDHYLQFKQQKFEGYFYFNTAAPLIDSLKVLGKYYNKVDAMPNNNQYSSPYIAFFDEFVGCIKIKFVDGETWELLSIKN